MQQHEGEQGERPLGAGQQLGQGAGEADGFGGEVDATVPVALVEDQVEHGEDGVQTGGERVRVGHAERDPGLTDLRAGPA